jgi:repressor LexA
MTILTRKQQQILDFLVQWQQAQGSMPSFQEVADRFGFRSLNSVTTHVRLLRQKGVLGGEPGKARALRVLTPLTKLRRRIRDIPLFGSIPAGLPQTREQERRGAPGGIVSRSLLSNGHEPSGHKLYSGGRLPGGALRPADRPAQIRPLIGICF